MLQPKMDEDTSNSISTALQLFVTSTGHKPCIYSCTVFIGP
jgi:hypothetical protein